VNEEALAHWGGGAVAPKTNKIEDVLDFFLYTTRLSAARLLNRNAKSVML